MTNAKHTKKALFASVMSLLLCFAMLVGTTFAWFTDSASTNVNKIQSGKLDIELQMKDADGNWVSAEGETLDFVKAEGREAEEILWEPNCTYNLQDLRLVNNSNLALKYKVIITGIKGDAKLNEVIEWTIKLGGEELDIGKEMVWLPNESTEQVFTISGHMKEDANNDYQNLTIDGIAITVVATQYTYEHDSNNNQYDADAKYPVMVSNSEELNDAVTAAKDGDVVLLTDDVTIDSDMSITNDITINGNGNAIVGKPIRVNGANVTFKDVDMSKPTNTNKNATLVYISTGSENVVFDGCTFSDPQWEAIQITSNDIKNVTITNCTFEVGKVDTNANTGYGSKAGDIIRFIHIQPSSSVMPVMNMTITNNTFKNCDKVASEIIGIYYVGEGSTMTAGGNTFEDVADDTKKMCVGYPIWIEELMTPKDWTGDITTYTVPAQK